MWRFRLFNLLYWSGMVGAVGLAFSPLFLADAGHAVRLLLPFSVAHMAVLSVMGFLVLGEAGRLAGEKVQTAGYLHTLNGFSAALLLLTLGPDGASLDLRAFLAPLGSALLTSVIGWFVGGEIVGRGTLQQTASLADESLRAAQEMQNVTSAMRTLHQEQRALLELSVGEARHLMKDVFPGYRATLASLLQQAEQLQDQVARVSTAILEIGPSITTALSGVERQSVHTVQLLERSVAAAVGMADGLELATAAASRMQNSMGSFTNDASQAQATYLAALAEATGLLAQVRRQHTDSLKACVRIVERLSETIVPLSDSVSAFAGRLERVSHVVDTHLGDEFASTLANLQSGATSTADAFRVVALQAQDSAEYLRQTQVLYQELERIFATLPAREPAYAQPPFTAG